MRRRDATDQFLLQSMPRAATVRSFALSLGLHAVLLATASLWVFDTVAPARPILVSLILAGGGAGVAQSAEAPHVQPGVQSTRPHAPVQAARPRHRRLRNAQAAVVAVAPTPAADAQLVSADDAGGSAAPAAGGGLLVSVGAGNGALDGTGSGTAAGAGGGASDQRTRCIVCPEPNYPLVARRRGWQGTVEVGVSLLADGSVAAADVRRSCGYETLDREAVAVARRSRFSPLVAGPAQGRIDYRFELTPTRP